MWFQFICAILSFLIKSSVGLMCYNCSSTQTNINHCAGDFAYLRLSFNHSKIYLNNCTHDGDAMCFVRSWRARASHIWMVQRGCYYATKDDRTILAMNTPNRAMSCRSHRYPEGEYKICMCQANWCNIASSKLESYTLLIIMALLLCFFYSNVFLMEILKFYKAVS